MSCHLSIFITSERSGSVVFLDQATGRWVYTDDKLSSMSEGNFRTKRNSIFLNGPYEEVEKVRIWKKKYCDTGDTLITIYEKSRNQNSQTAKLNIFRSYITVVLNLVQ